MSDDIDRQVRQVAADVFNLRASQVTRKTSPDSISTWDSVQHLNFVLALEETLNVRLDPEDIEQMRSVGDAIDVIHRKRG